MKKKKYVLFSCLIAMGATQAQAQSTTVSKPQDKGEETVTNVEIDNITVTAPRGIARKTPIAMSNVDAIRVDEKLGGQEFPEVLNQTPGVYATKFSGGRGDSKLNVRGFQNYNVAVMMNGVPVNDMEWGGIYWSNWAGLSEVVRYVQVQRGLGASKIAAPSVGGTVNIVTKTTDSKKGGSVLYGMGNDGYNTYSLALSTGLLPTGWNMSVMFTRTWGNGYIQGTEFSDYTYFFSVSKRINDSHQLSVTGFASPQSHYQRSQYDGLSVAGWQKAKNFMNGKSQYRYNPTYGFGKNGERKTSAYNYYHKPQFSMNHQWQINDKSSLSSALYLSIGHGYGNSGQGVNSSYANNWYGASNGVLNEDFHHSDGTYAYDKVQEINEQSTSGSKMVMGQSYNNHVWYGLLSTYTRKINKALNLYAGIDVRSYKGTHTTEISDLYNGEYYTDLRYRSTVNPELNAKAADPAWQYEKLGVGDIVNRDYDSHIAQQGVFAQMEYSKNDKLSAFVSGTLSNSTYWRYDRFYYDADHAESDKASFISGSIKGGANYNIDKNHNVYANVGFVSRAPIFAGGVFLMSQSSNVINKDAVNEKTISAEIGYGYHNNWLSANVNAYYTLWKDKTTSKSGYTNNNTDLFTMYLEGVDARHIGIEFDAVAKPMSWVTLRGMLSLGNWKWVSDANAYFYNSANQPLANLTTGEVASGVGAPDHLLFTLKQNGNHVGGSAQTTMALGSDFNITKNFTFGATYTYYARNYADFAMPTSGTGTELTLSEPWKIPGAGQLDLNARYNFMLGTCKASLYANVQNLLDYEYIKDAYYDGTHNGWEDAYRIFYSYGRTFTMKLRVEF